MTVLVGEALYIRGRLVDQTTTPSDGQAIVYNSEQGKWVFQTISGGSGGSVSWYSITDKPSTFTPSSHGSSAHTGTIGTESQITFSTSGGHSHSGTDSTVVSYTSLANVPSTFTPASHGSSAHTGTIGSESQITFSNTGGHAHNGTDSTRITWASIDKTTSSIADITTRSHTSLTDIGTNTHAQIDTFITSTVPAYFNTSTGHDHDGADSKQVSYTNLTNVPSTFTPSSHGSSAHSGTIGTESQITFTSSGGHSHDGTGSTKVSYTNLLNVPSTFTPSSHGSSAHSGTIGTESQITFTSSDGHSHDGTGSTKVSYTNLLNVPSTFAPSSHGSSAHTGTIGDASQISAASFPASTSWAFSGASTVEIINSSAKQLRLTHTSGSVYTDIQTDSIGNCLISPSGTTTTTKSLLPLGTNSHNLGSPDYMWNHAFIGKSQYMGGLIEFNYYGTGDRNTYIDFHSDDTNTDYSARIIRYPGVNGSLVIINSGTGNIGFIANNSINAQYITSAGLIGINQGSPARRLEVLDSSNPQLRLTHTSGSVYTDLQTDSSGHLAISASGGYTKILSHIYIPLGKGVIFPRLSDSNWTEMIGSDASSGVVNVSGAIGSGGGNTPSLQFRSLTTSHGTLTGIGRWGFGTSSPSTKVEVLDSSNPQLRLTHTSGSVYTDLQTDSNGYCNISTTGNRVIVYDLYTHDGGVHSSSDKRLKNVRGDCKDALAKICRLSVREFTWKSPEEHNDRVNVGLIADEVEEVFPEWVTTTTVSGRDRQLVDGEAKTLSLGFEFFAYIVASIKELAQRIEALEATNT